MKGVGGVAYLDGGVLEVRLDSIHQNILLVVLVEHEHNDIEIPLYVRQEVDFLQLGM